ncbi:C42S2 protein, partial [Atractosteus spatula]|nr:C42S2 protein [Atractosteus spatula]
LRLSLHHNAQQKETRLRNTRFSTTALCALIGYIRCRGGRNLRDGSGRQAGMLRVTDVLLSHFLFTGAILQLPLEMKLPAYVGGHIAGERNRKTSGYFPPQGSFYFTRRCRFSMTEFWVCFSCCIAEQPQPKRRRRIDRSMIGEPMNFVHTTHVGSGDMNLGHSSVSHFDHFESQMNLGLAASDFNSCVLYLAFKV